RRRLIDCWAQAPQEKRGKSPPGRRTRLSLPSLRPRLKDPWPASTRGPKKPRQPPRKLPKNPPKRHARQAPPGPPRAGVPVQRAPPAEVDERLRNPLITRVSSGKFERCRAPGDGEGVVLSFALLGAVTGTGLAGDFSFRQQESSPWPVSLASISPPTSAPSSRFNISMASNRKRPVK